MVLKVLNVFTYIFLNSKATNYWDLFFNLIFIIGIWKLLKKSGAKPIYALIPGYRYYELSRCADQEPQGRVLYVLHILSILVDVWTYIFRYEDSTLILLLISFPLALCTLLYSIQIYLNLIDIYQVKRIWVLLWMFFPGLPAIIWGFSPKFHPAWQLNDIALQKEIIISGTQAAVMEKGMTVNLEERSVLDFFKKKYLLRDVHMYIPPKHMVLLLGGSGAGKSTLINAINGYEKAKAEIVLNGKNLYSNYKKMQYDIGFVPQQELMRPRDTVYHTLLDAAALRLPDDLSGSERKKRVQEVMNLFGLLPVKNSKVEKLSGGQKKRLSIAMEFIPNPSLFILDEPDSGLDGVMARELMEHLRKIADLGKIVIVITHTPDRVIDLFDDVIVLAKDSQRTGRLAYYGSIEEAKNFFDTDKMEKIVMKVNRKEEGGEGRADEFITKYAEVLNG